MSGDRILLDSVILIDHFNGVEAASAYLREHRQSLLISAITRAEVLTGFDLEGEIPARALLDCIPLLVVDGATADLAASLRRTHRWRLPDALQAASALQHACKLATRNTRDFPPQRFEWVVTPYKLM